jgi:glyoxylase-like metal-dependent hydrolase (beta-lactamase superfamily II)
MKAYIESLQLLLRYPLHLIAPGHGEVMEDSRSIVEWLVNHRLQREGKVIGGLQRLGRSSLDELVKVVYDDVDVGLHEMAKLSMTAHLIKLQRENRVVQHEADGAWELFEI